MEMVQLEILDGMPPPEEADVVFVAWEENGCAHLIEWATNHKMWASTCLRGPSTHVTHEADLFHINGVPIDNKYGDEEGKLVRWARLPLEGGVS